MECRRGVVVVLDEAEPEADVDADEMEAMEAMEWRREDVPPAKGAVSPL